MNELELPVMSMSTNLNTALASLKKSRRAALVSEHEGEYHLFSAEKIAVARHRKLNTLSDLISDKELKPVIISFQSAPGRIRGGATGRKKTMGGVSGPTKSGPAVVSFSLKDVGAKLAVVAVRNVSIAARFAAAPRQYCCDGPRHHSFPPPDVSVGDPCPHQDGYKIVII